MATTQAGAIGVSLTADNVQFDSSMDKSAAVAERSLQRTARAHQAAQKDADRFISSIQKQVDSFGLTGTALLRYEAQLKGVSDQANPLIDRLEKMRDAQAAFNAEAGKGTGNLTRGFSDAEQAAGGAAHGAAGLTRELLVLGHEASQGNYKRLGGSLVVLGELLVGAGASTAIFLAGVVALAAPVLAVAAAALAGSNESKKLRDSLQLTGNAAGVTAGQVDAMSRALAASANVGIGKARTALEELIKTGEVGPKNLGAMTTAVVRLEALTGESAEAIVKDFAKMGDGVAKWAAEHNKQYNFISGDQYAYIKRLEEQGQKEQAEGEVLRLLNEHLKDLHPNLGLLESAWKTLGEQASAAWDAMKGIGRAETVESRLDAISARLNSPGWSRLKDIFTAGLTNGLPFAVGAAVAPGQSVAELSAAQGAAQNDLILQRRAAAMDAATAASHRMQVAAIDARDKWREETKGLSLVNKELERYRTLTVDPLKGTANEISPAEQAATEAAIRKKYNTRESGALDNRFTDRKIALEQEGVRLDAEIKSWELYGKSIDKARLATLNIELEQGKLGKLSEDRKNQLRALASADDAKDKILAETKARVEGTAEIDKYIAKLHDENAVKATNARQYEYAAALAHIEAIAKKDGITLSADVVASLRKEIDAKHDQMLANKLAAQQLGTDEEVAKINEQIAALRMSTLERQNATIALKIQKQAEKDVLADPAGEVAIRAAAIRQTDELTAANTRLYEAQRTAETGARQFFQKYQEEASDAAKVTETLISQGVKGVEDSLTAALTGQKVNLHSVVDAMIQEIIRLTIVKPLLADIFGGITGGSGGGQLGIGGSVGLLGSLANLLGGGGGGGTGIGGAEGSIFSVAYAQGTNYVPNDGPAYLHKGEAVIPAAVNAAGKGGGQAGALHVYVTPPAGMDRGTALQHGRDIGAGIRQATYRNG